MTKGYSQEKATQMDLFWVTARQVIWRTQPHTPSCQQERKETEVKKDDHPRR